MGIAQIAIAFVGFAAIVDVVRLLGTAVMRALPPSGVYVVGLVWLLISGSISFIVIVSVLE